MDLNYPPVDDDDWRSQIQHDSRQTIVNNIVETLKSCLPFSGQEGFEEIKQFATRFEEKMYNAATNQDDYLRKISPKVRTVESNSENALPNVVPFNSSGVSRNIQEPGIAFNRQPPPAVRQPPPAVRQPPIGNGDWRSQLQPDSRQRITNKIMDTLTRQPHYSSQNLEEMEQMAIRIEEQIYGIATTQSDYLRKISLKMLTVEARSQNTLHNAVYFNSVGVSRNSQDAGR